MIPKGLLNGGIRESPPNGRPSVCIQEGSLFVFGFCWTGNASTATGASTVRHAARRLVAAASVLGSVSPSVGTPCSHHGLYHALR